MTDKTRLHTIVAPYGREVWLDEVPFESGMRLLRITIREGRRFTVLDLDAQSAAQWGEAMTEWSNSQTGCDSSRCAS
ncbi:DUF6967 family protein [Blastochloris sulfoviridis]|uniref:Uncharacterized protein n=1 Tax=Blastochloris sulfoviridis TaxID=50712 RepID=A0A5M6I3I8_9HYPH|nr:hypothetical protein [Blastochloris sulfoviridis]KAA5602427.1 hypothetical protein F1193_05885 [Blastochloris sulfoviridis]